MADRAARARGRALRAGIAVMAFALLLPLWGCPAPRSELLRRYADYRPPETSGPDATGAAVRVSVFTAPVPGSSERPLIRELSASAQAAYVRSLAETTSTAEAFQRALAAPLGGGGDPATAERDRVRRRLVLSVEGPGPAGAGAEGAGVPGARIAWLRVVLRLPGEEAEEEGPGRHARFTSWDRFRTRLDTVELGTMGLTRSGGGGATLGLTPGALLGELGAAEVTGERSAELTEAVTLRERPVSNGILRPKELVLIQEGARGRRLAGNSVVTVEIQVGEPHASTVVHRIDGLFDEGGRARPPDSARLTTRELFRPPRVERGQEVTAELTWEALVRTVRRGSGDATFTESDDRVAYRWSRGGPEAVSLVPGRELRVSAWQLLDAGCRTLMAAPPAGGDDRPRQALTFATREEARRLLRWLRATAAAGPGGPLEVAGRALVMGRDAPLARSEVSDLYVRLHPVNWSPPGGYSVCP